MSGRIVWLVTEGGAASASAARIVSRHRSWERAQHSAACRRGELFRAGDLVTRCGVEHIDTFLREGGVVVHGRPKDRKVR